MRSRWLVIGGAAGAILGAAIAYVGAMWVFVCRGGPGVGIVVCAEPDILLPLFWGVPIGLAVGLLTGWAISRRESAR